MRRENDELLRDSYLQGVDPSTPEEGYYKRRLTKGGVEVPIKIWFGFGIDPVTGETIERRWGWHALRDGELVDVFECWPGCSGSPISKIDYDLMFADAEHCRKYMPDDPKAKPREAINLRTMPPIKPPGV